MSNISNTEILDNLIVGYVPHRIYAFSTQKAKNYLKVGETSRSVNVRLGEWKRVIADLKHERDWLAMLPKSAEEQKDFFQDFALHKYFESNGFVRMTPASAPGRSKEFFPVTLENVEEGILTISADYDAEPPHLYTYLSIADNSRVEEHWARTERYELRDNQKEVLENIVAAASDESVKPNFLLFAVMRFGKTFVSLKAAKALDSNLTVVVSAKADVKGEWKRSLEEHKDFDGYVFLDDASRINEEFENGNKIVLFLTLQDFKGQDVKDKHKQLFCHKIDLMIVDESHFGARAMSYGHKIKLASDGEKDDEVKGLKNLESLNVTYKLHLSGTPYRILMGDEFSNPKQIVGKVRFEDILAEKEKWFNEHLSEPEWKNPYFGFPQMIRFAFNLDEDAMQKVKDLTREGATSGLNELFGTITNRIIINRKTQKIIEQDKKDSEGKHRIFKHPDFVLKTLKALDGSEDSDTIFSILNYPKLKSGKMARHMVMVLPYKASCDAMETMFNEHKSEFINLNEYEVINIAGHDCPAKYNSIDKVKSAIKEFESESKKTVCLTVNKMLTGVTVPQWDTMIYMKGTQSPQEYDQAIYRLQSPYVTKQVDENGIVINKEDLKPQTLLIDFAPNRMMSIEQYKAFILSASAGGAGNDVVEAALERQMTVSPIITVDAGSLTKINPADILKYIAAYSAEKGMIEEASQIAVDLSILDDDIIKAAIDAENEINSKRGIKFSNTEDSENSSGSDDVGSEDGEVGSSSDNNTETSAQDETDDRESEQKSLEKKIQNYYLRILFYAFLSKDKNINNFSDVIHTYDNNERLARHLGLKKDVLQAIKDNLENPWVRSDLDNKISNANSLLADDSLDPSEKVSRAIRSFNRISESEVFTPRWVAEMMVEKVLDEMDVSNFNEQPKKMIDLTSKSGIYLLCLFEALKERGADEQLVAKNLFAVATSPIAYEFTRKVYELMGWNVKNIIKPEMATSYDLINKTEGESNLQVVMDYFDTQIGGGWEMKFDVVVGNPPYQDESVGGSTSNDPIYNHFYDLAEQISPQYCLISPARFLSRAGYTPRNWNEKMLADEHLKVVFYEQKSVNVFPNTDIKGGVVVIYRDKGRMFGNIGTFTSFKELNSILIKVSDKTTETIETQISGRGIYRLTDLALSEYPQIVDIQSKGHKQDVGTNSFKILGDLIFFDAEPKDGNDYTQVLGLFNNQRVYRYVRKDFINQPFGFDKWRVVLPNANGSGAIGEVLSTPLVGEPLVGFTETFISIGAFDNEAEAQNCLKYVKSKFARTMLGVLKVTQHNPREKWSKVPLQDFTPQSDIDWTQSIPEIDKQLYKKYGLDEKEIAFIEEKVKAME